MATIMTKALGITESNAEQYCIANGLELNDGGHAFRKWLDGGTDGYAILNDAAKALLYPSTAAHPFKLDSSMRGSRSAGSMTAALEFDSTAVHSESFTSTAMRTKTRSGITSAAVTSSTRSTVIRWHLHGANTNNQRIETADITLYFYRYACEANAVGNGVESAAASDAAPYEGDTVTFTATLKPGATWRGWYSDAACTQLVSSNQTYACSAADLTLYAKATIDTPSTGIYAKTNGAHREAQAAYKKTNGVWVKQTDTATLKNEMKNMNLKASN